MKGGGQQTKQRRMHKHTNIQTCEVGQRDKRSALPKTIDRFFSIGDGFQGAREHLLALLSLFVCLYVCVPG